MRLQLVGASLLLLAGVALSARAEDEVRPTFGKHHGYVFDVQEERNRRDIEMVMLSPPKPKPVSGKDVIVNERLSREFQQQYENRFGRTQSEQIFNIPSRSDEYIYYNTQNITTEQYQAYQQDFGEYMARRLIEFHVDDYVKKDRTLRPVYQAKERISNLDVKVREGYKFKWKYNFAGPNMDLRLENPYKVDARVRVEMSGIVSAPVETIYDLGYPLTRKVTIAARYKEYDGLYQLIGTRRLTDNLSTSLTGSTDTKKQGPQVQQDLILVGLSWSH